MKDIYEAAIFKKQGFYTKRCISCDRIFRTLDSDRRTCGDTPCDEYTFIGRPVTKKRYTLPQMEKAFLKFFERHGHTVVKRYPVVARWRDDIFLTIASIADFQPWVTSGLVPPPANPLVVSQPSIRLNDVDNVGRSGRHFTLFFMGGHHAFNSRKKHVYWNDETVALCHEFLTRELGIKPEEITYIQDFWEGGGNAGEDFEVNVRGLELATLVFMRYAKENGKYAPLPLNIVDTGYGMERLAWISQGTTSAYEAVFGDIIAKLMKIAGLERPPTNVLQENSKLSGLIDIETGRDLMTLRSKVAARVGLSIDELDRMMAPLEAVYSIADHLRCLAFMFGDRITPSNVKEGYLARLVLRRTLRLMRELKLEKPISELMALELEHLYAQFPEFREHKNYILEVIGLEEERYRDTLSRGSQLVERVAAGLRQEHKALLPKDKLIELYDSHGLPPEIVKEVSAKLGVGVEVPDDFYIQVANMHSQAKRVPAPTVDIPKEKLKRVPKTKQLFYESPYAREFEAKVLASFDGYVALDRTAFYPEGGGQPSDVGALMSKADKANVLDVQKVDGVVVHKIKPNVFKVGQKVRGVLNWSRREALMRHHTATHIILGAARKVLGDHIWQAGAQKGVESTRLDISHFKRISEEELQKIEMLANRVVMENRAVKAVFMDRNLAEKKYGFDLYQGGVVPGEEIRVVEVEKWNTQACAGTHYTRTGEVGPIKIIRTERIQDGVERLEFAAGEAAVKLMQRRDEQLAKAAEILRIQPEQLAKATKELFDRWKVAEKELAKARAQVAGSRLAELKSKAVQVGVVRMVSEVVEDVSVDELIKMADALIRDDKTMVAVLGTRNTTATVVAMAGEAAVQAGVDCGKIIAASSGVLGGGGGGRPELGQGGGPGVGKLKEALKTALNMCEQSQQLQTSDQ
ncbi:MAG: alanine--tRNA ligase [Candidatus Hadarchaeum sp.]|nr:alanine--tRNA ligase [Candidatus Hadarchaeum sp.]